MAKQNNDGILEMIANIPGGIVQGVGDTLSGIHRGMAPGYYEAIERSKQNRQIQLDQNTRDDFLTQLNAIKEVGKDSEAGRQMLANLSQHPYAQNLLQGVAGKGTISPTDQSQLDTETQQRDMFREYWDAQPDKASMNPMSRSNAKGSSGTDQSASRIKNLTASLKNLDEITDGNPESVDAMRSAIAQAISKETGIDTTVQPENKERSFNLASMLSGKPQDSDRKGWLSNFGDDTISPETVKQTASEYVATLVADGVPEDKARSMAMQEFAGLKSEDNGFFRKYPDVDITQMFTDQDSRKQAIKDGKPVVDTGDGVDTTPTRMEDVGITSPQMQAEWQEFEEMIGPALEGFDLKADYKRDPEFYQKLLQAIRTGVPDGSGNKRKLSVKEIIELIQG